MSIKDMGFTMFLAVWCASTMRGADPFEGSWVNRDKSRPDITRAEIRTVNGQLGIHLWGNCVPSDCDWGERRLEGNGTVRHVTWQFDFKSVTQELTLTAGHPPALRIVMHTHFADNSGRADYESTQVMAKLLQQ